MALPSDHETTAVPVSLDDLAKLITSGGDERIDLKDNLRNKYHVNPTSYKGVLNRGTCTCSSLTEETLPIAQHLAAVTEGKDIGPYWDEYRKDLKGLLNHEGEDKFDIFFSPSGSDLCYFPILFARLLWPEAPIKSLLTCPEELGTGSIFAASGKYFNKKNQFGEPVEQYQSFDETLDLEIKTFPARDEEGNILNHHEALMETIENHPDHAMIGNLVIGSKSGIEENMNIIPKVERDMLWVVDICQFRASKRLINRLIEMGAMLMITGSKFYQSPPFCGAMLVPKTITNRINEVRPEVVKPLSSIFSKHNIPPHFPEIRKHLRDHNNRGLLIRWASALHEMKALSKMERGDIFSGIGTWNDFILSDLQNYPDLFELMPNTEATNKTIIAFHIKGPAGRNLDYESLQKIHVDMTINKHEGLNGYDTLLIGQPVQYNEKSFIRLALGANGLRRLIAEDFDLHNDRRVIEIIAETARKLFW